MKNLAVMKAAMVASSVLGRFGATKDNSPEAFQAGIQIEGSGRDKNASRHSKTKPNPRPSGMRVEEYYGHQPIRSSLVYDALTALKSRHGRCTEWIRENRRRRAAGIPQLRVGK